MSSPTRLLFVAIVAASIWNLAASPSVADGQQPQLEWLEGFTLIVLDSDDAASLHRARGLIESHGGQIAILSPPSLLMGWVPFELRDELIGREHIKQIFFTDLIPGEVEIEDQQTRHMVTWFNRVIRGEYQEQYRRLQRVSPEEDPRTRLSDVWLREDFDEGAYNDNLRNNGFDVQRLKDQGILLERSTRAIAGNSDRMMGTVATTVIFAESDGTGADPDTYTWTDQHVQDYIAGVNTGLAWWSSRSRDYNDCWVAFYVRYFPPTDSRCQQWREMVLHPSADVADMVSDIMDNFGYAVGGHWTQVDAFNTAQRSTYGTEWSYTAFVAYNPWPAPTQLTDGHSAFAYWAGPYTFLLHRSSGWAPEQVFAHESGHIFKACDEYAGGCTSTSCTTECANGVVNGNCEECTAAVPCMMRNNSFLLCSYTDDHVGWQLSPCAPPPLAPPTVSTLSLASGVQGADYDVTIAGSDFVYGAFADFGDGVTLTNFNLVNPDTILVSIAIDNDATPGPRDVVVYNRDMQSSTTTGGFEVMTSTRHYVSLAGAAVFPYVTPANAATTFSDALDAAGEGDSLLVESTTIGLSTLNVTKAVTFSGAWTGGFSGRDVVNSKTTLDLSGNILILAGAGETVIEGFVLENGTGSPDIVPRTGNFGGAVKIFNSTVKISHCEIRQCQATGGSGFSGGGGVFAYGSYVTIEDSFIHDNTATFGGGVYLHNCTAIFTGNTIADNVVTTSSVQPAGGGIALEECGLVIMTGNTIDGNTGSREGGGVWAKNSNSVVVGGGVISNNTSSFSGAGIWAFDSNFDLDGVTISRNVSSTFGGGLSFTDSSDAVVSGCELLWNTALIGGGMYYSDGILSVRHNLFVGNNATSSGGAVYISGVAAGEMAGNTLDRNSGLSGGGLVFINSPFEVYNNIVVNTTGHGVQCSSTPATLSYNDVWNSSGDDYNGCAPGAGAVSLDPAFVDTTAGDYHLGVHSAGIDAGRPGAQYEDPDGSRGDMGWYGSHTFVMDQPKYAEGLTAELTGGDVVLRWNGNPEGDIDAYAVYCDSVSGFTPSLDNFVQFVSAPDTSVTLTAPGDSAYYRVGAVDGDGYAGGYSNQAVASPLSPVVVQAFAARLFENAVELTWIVHSDGELIGYDLYRAPGNRDDFNKLNPSLLSVGTSQYADDEIELGTVYRYRLMAIDYDGNEYASQILRIATQPLELRMVQNYPNPFNPTTTIEFTLPRRADVKITVYTAAGAAVRTLVDRPLEAGPHSVEWNGKDSMGVPVGSGIYFCTLRAGKRSVTQKMTLLK